MKRWIAVSSCLALTSLSSLSTYRTVDLRFGSSTNQFASYGLKTDTQESGQIDARKAGPLVEPTTTISPYEIRRYIDQHKEDGDVSLAEYWHRLGIGIEEWEKYGTCEAEIFELELDRQTGAEVMLRLYDHFGSGGTRYVIFKPDKHGPHTNWKLLGYIDLEDQRYDVPEHRVISSGEHHWLVLTVLAGRGSGYRLNHDLWYEIDEGGAREVLGYPASKYMAYMGKNPALETRSKIISATTESGTTKVVIEFSASYLLYDDAQSDRKTRLWTKRQRGTFIRRAGADEFDYDERESELSEQELDTVYDGEGPSGNDILNYNYSRLEKLASGKDERIRAWLRSYLDECKETPEKSKLLDALAQ